MLSTGSSNLGAGERSYRLEERGEEAGGWPERLEAQKYIDIEDSYGLWAVLAASESKNDGSRKHT